MEAQSVSLVLRRCNKGDIERVLREWGFLKEDAISDIDWKPAKNVVVQYVVNECKKMPRLTMEEVGKLDVICARLYSTKKLWSVFHLHGEQGKSSKKCLSDPRAFQKTLNKQMKLYFDVGTSVAVILTEGALWARLYIHTGDGSTYQASNTTYLVYYPRSPYVIMSRFKVAFEEYLFQGLMHTLGYSKVSNMQLTGHHTDSLIQLALNKSSQGAFSKYRLNQVHDQPLAMVRPQKRKTPEPDFDARILCEDAEVKRRRSELLEKSFGSNTQPVLEKLEYKVEVRFRGTDKAPGMTDREEPFRCRVKFEGPAVLEGIRNLGSTGLATVPLPPHLGRVHSLARNFFVLADHNRGEQSTNESRAVS